MLSPHMGTHMGPVLGNTQHTQEYIPTGAGFPSFTPPLSPGSRIMSFILKTSWSWLELYKTEGQFPALSQSPFHGQILTCNMG